jgi:hypothetical protein
LDDSVAQAALVALKVDSVAPVGSAVCFPVPAGETDGLRSGRHQDDYPAIPFQDDSRANLPDSSLQAAFPA